MENKDIFVTSVQTTEKFAQWKTTMYGYTPEGKNIALQVPFEPFLYSDLPRFVARIVADSVFMMDKEHPSSALRVVSPYLRLHRDGFDETSTRFTYLDLQEIEAAKVPDWEYFAKYFGLRPASVPVDCIHLSLKNEHPAKISRVSRCLKIFCLWLEASVVCHDDRQRQESGSFKKNRQKGKPCPRGDESDNEENDDEPESLFADHLRDMKIEREVEAHFGMDEGTLHDMPYGQICELVSQNRFIASVDLQVKKFAIGYNDGKAQILLGIRVTACHYYRKVVKFLEEEARWAYPRRYGARAPPSLSKAMPTYTSLLVVHEGDGQEEVVMRSPSLYGTKVSLLTQVLAAADVQLYTWVTACGVVKNPFVEMYKKEGRSMFLSENGVRTPYDRTLQLCAPSQTQATHSSGLLYQFAPNHPMSFKKIHPQPRPPCMHALCVRVCATHKNASRLNPHVLIENHADANIVSVAFQAFTFGQKQCPPPLIVTTKASADFGAKTDVLRVYEPLRQRKRPLGSEKMSSEKQVGLLPKRLEALVKEKARLDPFDKDMATSLVARAEGRETTPAFQNFFEDSNVFETFTRARVISCSGGEKQLLTVVQQFLRTFSVECFISSSESGKDLELLCDKGLCTSLLQNPKDRFFESPRAFASSDPLGSSICDRAAQAGRSHSSPSFFPSGGTGRPWQGKASGRTYLDVWPAAKAAQVKNPLDSHDLLDLLKDKQFNGSGYNKDNPVPGPNFDYFSTPFSPMDLHAVRLVTELRSLHQVAPKFLNMGMSVAKLCRIHLSDVFSRGQQFRIMSFLNTVLHKRGSVLNTEILTIKKPLLIEMPQKFTSYPVPPDLNPFNPAASFPSSPSKEEFSATATRDAEGLSKLRQTLCEFKENAAGAERGGGAKGTVERRSAKGSSGKPKPGTKTMRTHDLRCSFAKKRGRRDLRDGVGDPQVTKDERLSFNKYRQEHLANPELTQNLMQHFYSLENSPAIATQEMQRYLGKHAVEADSIHGRNMGGKVRDPEMPGKKLHNVFTLDFASLYPSIMMAFLICFNNLVLGSPDEAFNQRLLDPKHLSEGAYTVRFLPVTTNASLVFVTAKNGKRTETILPDVLNDLQKNRKVHKEKMKKAKTESERDQHNEDQLACKVTANGTYGLFGFRRGQLWIPRLSALVAATGKNCIRWSEFMTFCQIRKAEPGERDEFLNAHLRGSSHADSLYLRSKEMGIDNSRVEEVLRSHGEGGLGLLANDDSLCSEHAPSQQPSPTYVRMFGIVYGDTDSIMVVARVPPSVPISCADSPDVAYLRYVMQAAVAMEEFITSFYQKFLNMEFENVYSWVTFLEKKTYIASSKEPKAIEQMLAKRGPLCNAQEVCFDFSHGAGKVVTKGIGMKKRDRPVWIRRVANEVALLILQGQFKELLAFVKRYIENTLMITPSQKDMAKYLHDLSISAEINFKNRQANNLVHVNAWKKYVVQKFNLQGKFPSNKREELSSHIWGLNMTSLVRYIIQDATSVANVLGLDAPSVAATNKIKLFEKGVTLEYAIDNQISIDKIYYVESFIAAVEGMLKGCPNSLLASLHTLQQQIIEAENTKQRQKTVHSIGSFFSKKRQKSQTKQNQQGRGT